MTDAQTKVYREISGKNADLMNWLDLRNQLFNVEDPDGREHVFVDNDVPRDRSITPMIVDDTTGFALFDNGGNYVASYETLAEAVVAQKNARITISTDVSVDDGSEA